MFIRSAPQAIWDVSMLSVAGLSLWRGGWAERLVAWGMVVSSIATPIFENTRDWSSIQWGDLAVDTIYLALLVWVALRNQRLWTLFPAAFQFVSVVLYGARAADWRIGALTPYIAEEIFSYLILVTVVVGVWLRWRDRSARISPSPSIGRSGT